ncbi:MAG: hypothetical protein KA004_05870 [Verrucomicrobiales bacterium]|nr:hypothetical protein [Verrucomicrobiales bacterium]
MKCTLTTGLALATLLSTASAVTISDDFNDGNDTGWTHYEPLSGFGSGGTYTFPGGNSYNIATSAPSPNPGGLGPARAGSFRNDATYTDFTMSVDVLGWDIAQPDMMIGLLGRTTQIGLGSTDGYAVLLDVGGSFAIQTITNEAGSATLAGALVSLNPANDYRIVFGASGTNFTALLYDLTNPGPPISTISGSDATYASGVNGLFVYDSSSGGNQTAAANFDNYSTIPEPGSATLAGLAAAALLRRRRRA